MRTVIGLFRSSGFATLVLAIVLVWALAATTLLLFTLLNADAIDDKVQVITNRTSAIDRDLEAVRLAKRTNEIAEEILAEARPLSTELGREVRVTADIEHRAASILSTTSTIHRRSGVLLANVSSVNSSVESVSGNVARILDEAGGIRNRLVTVFALARSIDAGVEGINLRADATIREAARIFRDLGAVRREVGPDHREPSGRSTIAGHAHSIDCSPLVSPQRDYCSRP